jgi:hypothetical protein
MRVSRYVKILNSNIKAMKKFDVEVVILVETLYMTFSKYFERFLIAADLR